MSSLPESVSTSKTLTSTFPSLSSRRLLTAGGILLILVGMLFGDIFAVFVLHQNASRINDNLVAAALAVESRTPAAIPYSFQNIDGFLENRGTKVDTHVHMIDFGYLALLLALFQPWVAFSERARKRLAWIFLIGGGALPVGVFLIHYVGLAYSPLAAIGWASIAADTGGFLVLLVTAIELVGLARGLRASRTTALAPASTAPEADALFTDRSWATQQLLTWGTILVLAGFLHGAYYAAFHLFDDEQRDVNILSRMTHPTESSTPVDATIAAGANSSTNSTVTRSATVLAVPASHLSLLGPSAVAAARAAVADYAMLQGEKAVNIATHSHAVEFGMLALLMAFFQPLLFLSERWKRIWVVTLIAGSFILPVFVFLELHYGLLAGGIADIGGLLVIIALTGMLVGIIRGEARLDSVSEAHTAASPPVATPSMIIDLPRIPLLTRAGRTLITAGLALAIVGMIYGLYYAVFIEHQTLDAIGGSLASAFVHAAEGNAAASRVSLSSYAAANYAYIRQVDFHGHVIGLGMLLLVLGLALRRCRLHEFLQRPVAAVFIAGSVIFPLSVLLETASLSPLPRILAVLGSALVVVSLAALAFSFRPTHTRSAT
jgi:hypothetical protein